MPDNKPDSATEKEETAAPAEKPAASPGGLKAWLPLVITFVVMPALAFAMTKFVLVPQIQKGLGITVNASTGHGAETTKKKQGKDVERESVTMNKLLVNVAGTMGARYLLVSLTVAGSDPDFKDKMEKHDAQLRDMAMGALRTKTLADLEKPSAANLIRTELISGFNNILGDSVVEELYLTEFAIQ